MAREKAQLGFFISLKPPTRVMLNEAKSAGFYQPPMGTGRKVEALQLRTIGDLLEGRHFDFPVYGANVSYKQAEAVTKAAGQEKMEL